ncbi:MAG: carboxymuconolactone decarboxylase family protein [Gammaproteobacteria bacterium]|nr:carboxymuconolactone decarboxylase family protein [Gammaproteobacteria bacterium]
MLRRLIHRLLDRQERKLGQSMDWLRELYDVSPRAFWRFARLRGLLTHRQALPARAWAVAHMEAARSEDCGPCLQIGIGLAQRAGLNAAEISAVLAARDADLGPQLSLVRRFVAAVCRLDPEAEELRGQLRQHFGRQGEVDIALAIVAGRAIPMLKRGLGHAVSCAVQPPIVATAAGPGASLQS